ncbi:5-carboxymethyl-2-hydroxymuconate Delta-isomerase [Pseudogulbenkiania subflava]|uniref:5-carboxymethyl-2-hydroxymuconate isomerase n=1 Tax=Pseudogulbenkiania subflava DSM 22618 TaxID=1123014 RepID=A0A1Y6CEQ6_9NEIS|nr:5-carboxymethyl-2-hydroxymuconate Delta-isomerase [Pseudogulbenkiania subflava]SMF52304.1 5-carboxymethyl-2-hydroxymuconate isomerase [Pseudogulbenkiania subflava DSM 22618]
MPHLTLDYSSNLTTLDADRTLLALNRQLVESGQFTENDIKSRACRLEHFRIGIEPAPRAFAHVTLALLSGRTPECKQALSASLLAVLQRAGLTLPGAEVQLSVEVRDMERASYSKVIIAD